MPLARGCSRKTVSKNISKLMHEGGRSRSQIIAIALSEARRTGRGKCLRELGGHRRRIQGATHGSAVTVDDFASMVFADLARNHHVGVNAAEKLVNKNADLVIVDYEFWRVNRHYTASEVAKITAESIARKKRKK